MGLAGLALSLAIGGGAGFREPRKSVCRYSGHWWVVKSVAAARGKGQCRQVPHDTVWSVAARMQNASVGEAGG